MMEAPIFMTNHPGGQSFDVNDDVVAKGNAKDLEKGRLTVIITSYEFTQISIKVLHEIIPNRLNYHKLCSH